MKLRGPSSPPYSPDIDPSEFYLFTNLGSNEGILDTIGEYLGDQEVGFYFEGIRKL